MAFFVIGHSEHIPSNPKKGSRGVRGVGGGTFWALFHTFLVPFFNRWSDKKVQKIKKFGKGHISITRTKGFDMAF